MANDVEGLVITIAWYRVFAPAGPLCAGVKQYPLAARVTAVMF